eukprot:TRINITY_DN2347_c0_g1_i1.p1 TRINITY_DN2347_c0_g1~~TRINITY_DN2347_c0_g1_i1.p1  ORF type:complete len:386 (+),score=115.60 TRINITY_DN2347_c0_g1_i1:127-1284(+)
MTDNEKNVQVYENFDDMKLSESLLRGIYAYGFEKPSSIQQKAIVPLTNGFDVIAQAQSGTGKTGAFTIGTLQRIDPKKKECQALILTPTRELATQIENVIKELGYHLGIIVTSCVGGTDRRRDVEILEKGAHVVVGTPGRVFDMMRSDILDGKKINIFVLDEADEMLDKEGFQDIVYDIFTEMRKDVQIGLFSATLAPEVLKLTEKFMKDPVRVIVKAEELTLEGIRQYFVAVEQDEWKFDTLCDLYKDIAIASCVIFCNSRRKVDWLTEEMRSKDFTVSATHGSLKETERREIIKAFREGKSRVLITTDLLARGIDVQHVSIVINYDLPKSKENYLHRIGRSGRFGRKGLAINFVTNKDVNTLHEIEKFYNTQIEEMPSKLPIF